MTFFSRQPCPHLPSRLRCALFALVAVFVSISSPKLAAHPRMISYGHPNCSSCHVAPLGRGLLNGYGRGIDMEQSLAYSNLLFAGDHHFAGRYTLSARLNRNLTVGMTFGLGDLRRNLSFGQEGTVFATVKF